MLDFLRGLFGTDFMPHLYCLRGDPWVLWLQVVSDLAIAAAYFAIPLLLFDAVRARKDLLFRRIAMLFVAFIAFCGVTHVLAVWTIWVPVYRFEGVAKAATALVSAATAVLLIRLRPVLMKLPSPAQLEAEIVERLRAEQAAKTAKERLANVVDSVQDYAMYMIDVDGAVRSWNVGAQRIKGYTTEEIVGRHFSCFYTGEDIAAHKPEESLKTATEMGRFEGQGWRLRKDGSRFWAHLIIRPARDDAGALVGFSKVTRDLTESRTVEARYQTLLEAVPDAILIVDGDGRISFVNGAAERVFGYARAQMVGLNVQMLNPPRVQQAQTEYLKKLFDDPGNHQSSTPQEILGLRADGIEFPLEFGVTPLDTGEGRKLLFAIRDLTDRKRMDERFKAVLNAAPDGILVIGREGRIQLVNDRIEALFGYRPEELIGHDAAILAPEELRDRQRARHERFFRDPGSFIMDHDTELSALRKDGSRFYSEANFRPYESANGMAAVVTVRDVSERKKSEARFRALLESAPDAVLLIDSRGAIEFANANVERLYGYALNEVIGQPADLLTPLLKAEETLHLFHEALASEPVNEPSEIRFVREELLFHGRRKDGTEFPADVRIRLIKTEEGPMVYANIRDISAIKLAETRFRNLLESAPDAMVIMNSEGRIELINLQTEKLFGYSSAELAGQMVEVLVPQPLHEAHVEHRRGYFTRPKKREMGAGLDLMAVRKDGSEFPVEISLSPLEGPAGISVTAAIRDVTERKAASRVLAEKMDELRHSNEQLEQFAHIASHDLQEPLRMVASYTQLLAKRYKGRLDADADEFIGYAVEGTQRMKQLIEALLEYSRTGKGSPPVRQFSSELVLRQALATLRVRIEESGAVVTHDPLPTITASDEPLVQIFQNLVGNAIKYRGDRVPQIHISSETTEKEWIFSVADNGIGIDPRFFEKIFLIFQRLHSQDEFEGTGIGLAICHRILHQQGGRIWVESEPGQGATFYFALPVRSGETR